MILLQFLVDLSRGEYDASSVKDARQLARVAAVAKELFFVVDQTAYDRGYVLWDEAVLIRRTVKEWLDHASKVTYEDREQRIIVQVDRKISVMQMYQKLLEAGLSLARFPQELDAESERVRAWAEKQRAEAARAKAELQEAQAEAALFDKRYREYMESGDDYADAAAYFAARDAILAGEEDALEDARYEAAIRDMLAA
jgi:hypothetical protein